MFDKKVNVIVSPDLNKLKAVHIDDRTTIYVDINSNSDDAKKLYEERRQAMNIKIK